MSHSRSHPHKCIWFNLLTMPPLHVSLVKSMESSGIIGSSLALANLYCGCGDMWRIKSLVSPGTVASREEYAGSRYEDSWVAKMVLRSVIVGDLF